MKKSKKMMLGAMVLAVGVPAVVAPMGDNVKADELNGFTYKINEDGKTVTITGYNVVNGLDVEIPNEIEGKKVTNIGGGAFQNKGIESVKIPEGVKSIGQFAFYSNKIKELRLPNGLETIESMSFQDNIITELNIPESVTKIGFSSFENNKLTDIYIPEGITAIEQGAFKDNKLTNVVLGKNVKEIHDYAFMNNPLSEIYLPEGLKSLGEKAFDGTSFKKIVLPENLNTMKSNAFGNKFGGEINTLEYVVVKNKYLSISGNKNSLFSRNDGFIIYGHDPSTIKDIAITLNTASFRPISEAPEDPKLPEVTPEPEIPIEPETPPTEPTDPPTEPVEPPTTGGGNELWTPDKGGEFITSMVPEITVVGGKSVNGITLRNFDFGKVETVSTELGDITFTPDGNGNTVVTAPNGLGTSETSQKLDVKYNGTHILTLNVKAKPKLDFNFGF